MRRFLILLISSCVGCLDPYAPPASSGNLNALVVDGFIDANGSASVRLSRSIPLNEKDEFPKESGATITIESSKGEIFRLREDSAGVYDASGLGVDYVSKYVLHVVTADNHKYVSDEVMIYPTPPIDSVYWTISGSKQLEMRVDSHETNPNATGYYLTNGIETYEYHAPVYSPYTFVNKVAADRTPEEQIFACWRSILTTNSLTSTNGMIEKVISGVKVSVIERNSPKISVRYSLLVRQRSISEDEYTYQRQLKTTTEQQGSLFAQIPGSVLGNVQSVTNPDESVLGYFRGQEIKEFRYFMGTYRQDDHSFPPDFRVLQVASCQPEATCRIDQPPSGPSSCVPIEALSDGAIITQLITTAAAGVVAVYYVQADCGDCRIKGGSTTRPSFW